MVSGNLTAEIPIGEKFTLIAAGRRAYSDIYSTFMMDNLYEDIFGSSTMSRRNVNIIEPGFYFYDYNTKLSWRISQKEKLSLSIIYFYSLRHVRNHSK